MTYSRQAALIALGLACSAIILSACSGGSGKKQITVPYSAIEALDHYAFTSDVSIRSATGDIQARFDGAFQAPGRIQGMLSVSGSLGESMGLASEAEVIVFTEDNQAWWREPSGEWRVADGGMRGSLTFFAMNATPQPYITGLTFDTLHLNGTTEGLDGTETRHIRLTKADLVELLDQGTFAKEAGKDPEIIREDVIGFLPDNTTVEAWLTKDDLHPVRVILQLSAAEDDPHAEDFFLQKPFEIRLQLDITDTNADVQIEPPL